MTSWCRLYNPLWANPKSEGFLSSQLVFLKRRGLALLCVRLMSSHILTLSTFTAITVSLADKSAEGCQKVGPWLLTTWEQGMCVIDANHISETALAGQLPLSWCSHPIFRERKKGTKQVHISARWCNPSAFQLWNAFYSLVVDQVSLVKLLKAIVGKLNKLQDNCEKQLGQV